MCICVFVCVFLLCVVHSLSPIPRVDRGLSDIDEQQDDEFEPDHRVAQVRCEEMDICSFRSNADLKHQLHFPE